MRPSPTTAVAGLLCLAVLAVQLLIIVPGTHLPTGDGAHVLAAGWRIGASSAPLDDLLHRITPHPPLAYAPTALFLSQVGVRAMLGIQAVAAAIVALVGLRWLRPDAHIADPLVALALLLSSGIVWWSVDLYALDWPAAAFVLLGLGSVVRATTETTPTKAAGPLAAACLLAAIFTKYTAVFSLAGGILAALASGAWRRRATFIAGAIVVLVGVAWAAWALDDLSAYGAATVQQTGRGGPGGAVIRSPEVSFSERIQPARLRLWVLSMRDTLGWAPILAIGVGCAWTRLRSVGAQVALAGALVPVLVFPLMRLEPQPRYMLPTAGLLLAAALPSRDMARARLGSLVFAGLAIVSLVYSTAIYQGIPPTDRPGHRAATPTDGLGDWPWPARRSWPTRSPVESWGTAEALAAVEAQLAPGETAALVRFGFDPDRPSWASIDLVARAAGIEREWVVAESPRGPLTAPDGMVEPTWAWVSWTDNSAPEALAWVQTHADLEGAVTWRSSDGTGGVVLPLGSHHHHHH